MKKKKLRKHLSRPFIYMTFTRFLLALTAALLLDFFISSPLRDIRAYAFMVLVAVFAVLAWIAYLRLDGMKLPKLMMLRVNPRKKPTIMYGDMSDYTDEPVVTFDELEDDEKDICILGADLCCCVLFAVLSML